MNDEETPLAQFQNWYSSRARAGLDGQSEYVKFREAFYAGYAARPRPPIEPSRDALDDAARFLRSYGQQFPAKQPERMVESRPPMNWAFSEERQRFIPSPPADYTQHGTVTGRLPQRDVDYADKSQRFQEVFGVPPEKVTEVAGPSPETLQRVQDHLAARIDALKPDDTRDFPAVTRADTAVIPPVVGLEHTETVWDRYQEQYGAPGPVQTAYELEHGENG